jgi:hypothetical protein
MSIYEAIGMAWVIFTSTLASIEIAYLAFVGIKTVLSKTAAETRAAAEPMEVSEIFKIAR